MSTKKILVVSNAPFFGGGETFAAEVLSQLDGACFAVCDTVLASRLDPEQTIVLPVNHWWSQMRQVKRLIRQRGIDTVVLNGGSTIFMAPCLARRGVHIVVYRHTTNRNVNPWWKRAVYIALLHMSYTFARRVIHVSNHSLGEQKLFRSRSRTIHNGVRDTYHSPETRAEGPLRVLFLGRVDRSKGLKETVEAVRRFSAQQATLDVVGTGLMDAWLAGQCNDQIRAHGFQTEVDRYYSHADLYILLSHFENCPFTVIDAMKWGLPIVASPVGGIPELVREHENGFLVRGVNEAAEAINKLIADPNLRKRLGERSRELYLEHFTLKHTLGQVRSTIDEL